MYVCICAYKVHILIYKHVNKFEIVIAPWWSETTGHSPSKDSSKGNSLQKPSPQRFDGLIFSSRGTLLDAHICIYIYNICHFVIVC